jgi:hypothetical protein
LSSLTDRIVQLRKRASEITTQLGSIADRRKSYSLAAAEKDSRALKEIVDADFEADNLRKESQTISSAIESAEALSRQQELEAKRAEERKLQVEAHVTASAISALNAELDEMLLRLREAFERRASLLRSLTNIDGSVVPPELAMRLSNKSHATSAAHLVGLGRYLAMEMVPTVAWRALAEQNDLLLGIGADPTLPRIVPRTNKRS